jgi:hypothetical protein
MSKRNNVVEVLKPADPAPNVRAQLEQFIEQKLAEMMGDKRDGIFQPFFQPKAVAAAIRKTETVIQQRKWQYYFEEWGCLICESKKRGHFTLGMCTPCYHRTLQRLQRILRFTEREEQLDAPPFTPDRLTELASGAVRKQLSGETSPLETRAYITRADRKAQRKAERTAQREEAVRDRVVAIQERSASRKEMWRQARALHVEQKLTWKEIAERLDPDFDKDPKAAIARIESGARRVSPVRDLTDLAHAAVRRRS